MKHRCGLWVAIALCVAGCSTTPSAPPTRDSQTGHVELFNASNTIQDAWEHLQLHGATEYSLVAMDQSVAIQARGNDSASALIRRVSVNPRECRQIQWSWMVSELQPDADIRKRGREDVAASLFLLFGAPGFLFDPDPVPTLRYVWTNHLVDTETIVDSPYLPGTVRSLVVRAGGESLGQWVTESRDIVADYHRAFGHEPEGSIEAVAIFSDNDQTGQSVTAYYAWARVVCDP